MLSQLLSRAVQQADVRISTLNNLTVQLQNQTQHTVRRRVLGSKIQGIILISAMMVHMSAKQLSAGLRTCLRE